MFLQHLYYSFVGVLVVNVTWRGKTYVGTLLDATKHDWAPPRYLQLGLELHPVSVWCKKNNVFYLQLMLYIHVYINKNSLGFLYPCMLIIMKFYE